MAKRQTNRKVQIRLRSRDPGDPTRIFNAIEEAFRPREIEVVIGPSDSVDNVGEYVPNEPLETKAREAASNYLDSKDEKLAGQPDASELERISDDHLESRMAQIRDSENRLARWVGEKFNAGWCITVRTMVAEFVKAAMKGDP